MARFAFAGDRERRAAYPNLRPTRGPVRSATPAPTEDLQAADSAPTEQPANE